MPELNDEPIPPTNPHPALCGCCSNQLADGEETQPTDDGEVCQHCYDNHYYFCSECEAVVHEDHTQCINDETVCDSCRDRLFVSCEGCDEFIRVGDSNVVHNRHYCESCYEERCPTCENCSETISSDDDAYTTDDGETLCPACYDARKQDSYSIHDYSYKPLAILHCALGETTAGVAYYGLELEAEKPEGIDDTIGAIVGDEVHWYAKKDGSLENGVEFVSHPHTWLAWMNDTSVAYMLSSLRASGYLSFNVHRCGLHHHVSKSALKPRDLFRLTHFADIHNDFFFRLSRRRLREFGSYVNGYRNSDVFARASYVKTGMDSGGRYRLWNLNNTHTAEIRLYRGTLNQDSFWRNLGCTHALVGFAKSDVATKLINPMEFVTWLSSPAGVEWFGNTDRAKHIHTLLMAWLPKIISYDPVTKNEE